MENIETLTQLLKNSGCAYQVYDLGRRITSIDQAQFSSVEQGQQPYPYPTRREAKIAIAYWNEQRQPWIWFLRFPLDERGLFKQADIGRFIQYVVEAMGTRLGQPLDEQQQQKLANNPYTFKPSEEKMAVFHSQIRAKLAMPTSQYYQHARDYFSGNLGWDNWQTVGLQGISDICARLNEQQNGPLIIKALRHVPNQPRYALLGLLEHQQLSGKLAQTLIELTLAACDDDEPDLFLIAAYVRALAGTDRAQLTAVIEHILASPRLSHQEVLIGIAGRAWQVLVNTATASVPAKTAAASLAEQFLIRLAQTGNQPLFNQLFADLVMLPPLRSVLLPLLHSQPSHELATALTRLQQQVSAQDPHQASNHNE